MKIAKYAFTNGAVAYSQLQTMGAAMQANIELRRAEARLYADDGLAEYMTSATGGTISLGVKYIPDDAQKLLFGLIEESRSVTPTGGTATTVVGLGVSAKSEGNYVGVAFYCPALKDSAKKFWCCRIVKALFGPPSLSLQTKGENIVFNTPTTTGEMLMSDADDGLLYESAYVDSEAVAKAWVDASLTTA
jgi:hypothetical protein